LALEWMQKVDPAGTRPRITRIAWVDGSLSEAYRRWFAGLALRKVQKVIKTASCG
jgi:hypothetical protein